MTESPASLEQAESLSQRAARRLRGCLAENKISQTKLAQVIQVGQQKLSRKVTGFTPLTVDEIEKIAWALDVPVDSILGIGEYAERPMPTCQIRTLETTTAGGGRFFRDPAEVLGAPSGTRTPNPLIKSPRRRLRAVQGETPAATVTRLAGRPRAPQTARPAHLHLHLVGGAA